MLSLLKLDYNWTKLFAKLNKSSQKRQKRQKRHILALCFSLRARVESRVDIVRRKHVRAFNKSFPLSQ